MLICLLSQPRCDGIRGVPIERVPSAVVAASRAGVSMARGVLHVLERDARLTGAGPVRGRGIVKLGPLLGGEPRHVGRVVLPGRITVAAVARVGPYSHIRTASGGNPAVLSSYRHWPFRCCSSPVATVARRPRTGPTTPWPRR
jgi:hypothetical protein